MQLKLNISNQIEGNCQLIKLEDSRLDAQASVVFKAHMDRCLAQEQRNIILDLSNVDFIDSSGLGAMVSVLKRLGGDGTMVLTGINEKTKKIFELTRMDRVFDIQESPEQALKVLAAA